MNGDTLLVFMIVSFALALVVILKKDAIPDRMRRPLAIFSLFMVLCSFVLLVVTFLQMGS